MVLVYDVFLSFRGDDTRSGFTSHLYKALIQKNYRTFYDNDNLKRGKSIATELLKAIEDSRSSIVVLSKDYACSTWCLTELAKIVECMGSKGLLVLPIFYHVDPSQVRRQSSESYKEAFTAHEKNSNLDSKNVQSWRNALKVVGTLAGWTVEERDIEANFIEKFIENLPSILDVQKEYHNGPERQSRTDLPDAFFGYDHDTVPPRSEIPAWSTNTSSKPSTIIEASNQALANFQRTYANMSRIKMLGLKNSLTKIKKGFKTIDEYMQRVKNVSDYVSLEGYPLSDEELVVHVLNGLGSDYEDFCAAIRARDTPVSFEELHDMLRDQEAYLKRERYDNNRGKNWNYNNNSGNSHCSNSGNKKSQGNQNFHNPQGNQGTQNYFSPNTTHFPQSQQQNWLPHSDNSRPPILCQLCDKFGHDAKVCRSRPPPSSPYPQANFLDSNSNGTNGNELVDSGASHHIALDLQNLSMDPEYGDTVEIDVGNGKKVPNVII